jgi:hypothetical protein
MSNFFSYVLCIGGNRGWGIGFHGDGESASFSDFLPKKEYWPSDQITGFRSNIFNVFIYKKTDL